MLYYIQISLLLCNIVYAPDKLIMALEHIHQIKEIVERKRLRALMRRTDRHAWMYLLRHAVILAFTSCLVYLSIDSIFFLPAMFLHGVGIVHLFSPQHEFAHRTAFRTRWLNDFFGWIFGAIIMLPNVYFRWEHTAHHSYTQNSLRDPELIPQPKNLFGYFLYLSSLPYWCGFLKPFAYHLCGTIPSEEKLFLPYTERWKVIAEAWTMLLIYVLIGIYIVIHDSMTPLYYWLLPRLLAEPYMRMVRMSEHVGRPVNNANLLENTRTTLVNPLFRWLGWNMPYHAEHHLSPSVPFHALPALYDEIKHHHKNIAHGYLDAHKDIFHRSLHGLEPGLES